MALLDASFPNTFDGRCYFKQEPHERIVAYNSDGLVAQVGLDRRVINVAGQLIKIVGIIDLCVAEEYRRNGIGQALLQAVEDCSDDREFAVLMADKKSIYTQSGYFSLKPALTRWLAIDNLRSHSIMVRDLSDCFMYKPLCGNTWPDGEIDLLGYLF